MGSDILLLLAKVFVIPLFVLVAYILYRASNNKITVLLKKRGIKTINDILVCIDIVIVFLFMVIVVWDIDIFLVKAICSMVFLDIAAASVFLYGITLKE